MAFTISRGKHGNLLCEDDSGIITFELPAGELTRDNVVDIEGGIDVSGMDAWLDTAVAEVRAWLVPKQRSI